ncbi:MAG TPA: aldo/keto reductase [Chloroflexota bacterium]|nr:aldo/keto reductase [Chloroflexota bacterium]
MEYRRLGSSGLKVSAIGLGGNTFGSTADESGSVAVIQAAFDAGVNFIDTADTYGTNGASESFVGKAVKGRRYEVIIGTKVAGKMGDGPSDSGLSRKHIMDGVEASLKRLDTDYIDLYQAHRPDDSTPLEETLRAFDDLVQQGKVRYIGCSNYMAWQLAQARGIQDKHGLSPWISVQPSWNIVEGLQDPHLLPACREFGVGIIPFRPIASGVLTGKYQRGQEPAPGTRAAEVPYGRRDLTDRALEVVDRIRPFAEKHGKTLVELAIAWLLAHPECSTVIAGARKPEQVTQNAKASEWVLTPAERDEVTALAKGETAS